MNNISSCQHQDCWRSIAVVVFSQVAGRTRSPSSVVTCLTELWGGRRESWLESLLRGSQVLRCSGNKPACQPMDHPWDLAWQGCARGSLGSTAAQKVKGPQRGCNRNPDYSSALLGSGLTRGFSGALQRTISVKTFQPSH